MSTQVSNVLVIPQAAQSNWLTASEAAGYLKVKPRTLLQRVRDRKVPAHKLSGTKRCVWRFLKPELDAMLWPVIRCGCLGEEASRTQRHANGSVRYDKRRRTWNYLWCDGPIRRSKRIGTKLQFPSQGCGVERG